MDPKAILDYWFGANADDGAVAQEKGALWWKSNPAVDEELRSNFADGVESAGRNELENWASTPSGLLALILLCDQLPRNIHRNTPHAFAADRATDCHSFHACSDIGRQLP